MKTIILYTDIHRFGKHAILSDEQILVECRYSNVFFLGDIIDLAGCLRSDIGKATDFLMLLIKAMGRRYALGNHEMMMHRMHDRINLGWGFLGTHTAMETWGKSRLVKYMRKRLGKGKFGRFLAGVFGKLRGLKPVTLSQVQKDRFMDLCIETDSHTVFGGHRHPKQIKIFTYRRDNKTIKIVLLPRGRHEAQIQKDGTFKFIAHQR